MVDRPECYERREIEIPDCKESNPDDCNRIIHLYLPSIICDDDRSDDGNDGGNIIAGDNDHADIGDDADDLLLPTPTTTIADAEKAVVGTLPLVFGIHCYGCTAASITNFIPPANSHNVVLVLPEGLHNSFNARHCCGYALENDVDDVGFLKHVQSMLSDEYSFVRSDISYAVGWSNGGFMVMHAASLFRSISPISGHIYDIDPALKKGGTFCVDGICVDAPGAGKGIFLHHGANDKMVRPTGCCDDPDSPQCCCGIAADTCVPIMEVARNWALEVNGCELAAQRDLAGVGEDSGDDGEEEGEEFDEGDDGGEEDDGEGEGEGREGEEDGMDESTSVAGADFAVSYKDPERGIECLTTTGTQCKANTTICLHEGAGHFNMPPFVETFPFPKEVIEFFARDACGINDGIWNETSAVCACPETQGGTFCLDDPVVAETGVGAVEDIDDFYAVDQGDKSSKGSHNVLIALLLAVAMFTYLQHRYRRGNKKDDRYVDDVIDEEMEEAAELVPSRGRHLR